MFTSLTVLDWLMILLWVVGTSLVGAYFVRYVDTTKDYLLAGRRLRWWQVSAAQAADQIDASDFVSVSGHGYRVGMVNIGFIWSGIGFGFLMFSRWIVPLLYRSGVYTNAEFLELRYNAATRVVSVVLQTFYRFIAMAVVVYSMAVMFQVILGIDLWNAIWFAMGLTMLYVFLGGQLGVVMAAVPQIALMLITTGILFSYTWSAMGGWSSLVQRLGPDGEAFLHMGGFSGSGVPGAIYIWGLILTSLTYPIVNQTVAQRVLSSRSEVDARRGCVGNLPLWFLLTGINTVIGFAAVVLLPKLDSVQADTIFPTFMQEFLPPGLLGATMAAVMLASMSTGAGIGTALAGLFVVDIYARFFRGQESDRHYLMLSRIVAVSVILIGTLFAMLIPRFGGMVPFYVAFVGSLVLPLAVPYLGAPLYKKASRWSGLAATVGGALVGTSLFFWSAQLPVTLGHPQWRPFWAFGTAWICFFVCSFVENWLKGPAPAFEWATVSQVHDLGSRGEGADRDLERQIAEESGKRARFEEPEAAKATPWYSRPGTFELACFIFLVIMLGWWW